MVHIQTHGIRTKGQWSQEKLLKFEKILVIDNPNSIHAFNHFEEEVYVETYKSHFSLIGKIRADLYDMGVLDIEEIYNYD